MQFIHPVYFLWGSGALASLLFLAAVFEWHRGKYVRRVFSPPKVSFFLRFAAKYMMVGGIVALILGAVAQPYVPRPRLVPSAQDVYVAFLFDLSWSMSAKADKNGPSRIDRSKDIALSLLPIFNGGEVAVYGFTDRVGSFADFTQDYSFIRSTITHVIEVEAVSGSGSDIDKALIRVRQQFPEKTNKKKFIVFFSDGGDGDAHTFTELQKTTSFLKRDDIRVIAVGVGEVEGVVIGEQYGKPVVSKMNERPLQFIAERTNGFYSRESNTKELLRSSSSFLAGALGKGYEQDTKDISGWFIGAAVGLLWVLWFFWGNRRE
jgi:hypothetical protein